ncbi:DUF4224 domain-containing protein [Chitinasiproducens palmae]|nr:DUF4224 domain-containing protein [Chitinasiproducens palmae]
MNDYLSSAELSELVGCKPNQRAAMAAWLTKNHWAFVLDRSGLPKVARAYRDRKLGVTETKQKAKHNDAPNLQAFV